MVGVLGIGMVVEYADEKSVQPVLSRVHSGYHLMWMLQQWVLS